MMLCLSRRALVLAGLVLTLPAAAQTAETGAALPPGVLTLQAVYGGTGKPVRSGLEWRIFAVQQGTPVQVATSHEVTPTIALPPGEYMIHVAYGLASATKRITMPSGPLTDRLTLSAGGLILRAKLADAPVASQRQAIAVYIPAPNDSEGKLVTNTLKSGEILRLPEGTYHVVSTYAGSNSVVRADLIVTSGRVVEATMNHRAATVTLKLVRQVGGVALANTAWTVQTPGGDVIGEALGAFPTMELAEGEYDVIARNDGREFKDKMKVVSGVNRDHEVVMR
ncbi:MAG: hypothetical protein LCH61_14255 [Proteobacteria bacterium]|nr:hypothetical protein [Pseudomonadota bacterium]